ncbi:hypothetical protein C8J57DRAFT_1301425 [Mycena rebaudengoi]|nr:hypothetical protein C8J57DRAFT_1301425 [Mycena rebaudengoi]
MPRKTARNVDRLALAFVSCPIHDSSGARLRSLPTIRVPRAGREVLTPTTYRIFAPTSCHLSPRFLHLLCTSQRIFAAASHRRSSEFTKNRAGQELLAPACSRPHIYTRPRHIRPVFFFFCASYSPRIFTPSHIHVFPATSCGRELRTPAADTRRTRQPSPRFFCPSCFKLRRAATSPNRRDATHLRNSV